VLCASVWNASRSRLLHAQRKLAVLRFPDSLATAAWPASAASASRVVAGAAVTGLRQQPGSADHAAGLFEQGQEDRTVGLVPHTGRETALESLICALSVLSAATRLSTSARRVLSSSSPTDP
jgi:hypothetical protein